MRNCIDIFSQGVCVCSSKTLPLTAVYFEKQDFCSPQSIYNSLRLSLTSRFLTFSKSDRMLCCPFCFNTFQCLPSSPGHAAYVTHTIFTIWFLCSLRKHFCVPRRKGLLLPPKEPHPTCNKFLHITRFHVLLLSMLSKLFNTALTLLSYLYQISLWFNDNKKICSIKPINGVF